MEPRSKRSSEELITLKDRFVDNFVAGIRDGSVGDLADRIISDKFHPAWESLPDLVIDDSLTEEMADRIMSEDDSSTEQVLRQGFKMPDFIGGRYKVISTSGTANISALSMGFANLEVFGVTIDAVVASSIRIGDFRLCPNEHNLWVPSCPEDKNERGVFGSLWGSEVYARNSLYMEGYADFMYLLACPNKIYPRGLYSMIEVTPPGDAFQ
jgi:hypothetical protein